MKEETLSEGSYGILRSLTQLPEKILSLYNRDNVTEFVLHDLCNKPCFNLKRAAYFVDNPDFDCVKGVAGIDNASLYTGSDSIWDNPEDFSEHMASVPFNQKVRGIARCSVKRDSRPDDECIHEIAHELGFTCNSVCRWAMKHDNHGFVLYERADNSGPVDEYILRGLSLLGFCPIF